MVAIKRFNNHSGSKFALPRKEWSSILHRESGRTRKDSIPHHLIEERAHFLWDRSGRLQGRDADFWIAAERQLVREAHPVFGHFAPLENRIQVLLRWLKNLSIIDGLKIIGNFILVIAIVTYIANQDARYNREVFLAWQTITNAAGQAGSGGRKEAIEFLVSRPLRFPVPFCRGGADYPNCILRQPRQSLAGIDVGIEYFPDREVDSPLSGRGAYLKGLQVPSANLVGANLQNAMLSQANLQNAMLSDANLQNAMLSDAHINGAILSGANLQDAMLSAANLQDAFLIEANLENADLQKADLKGAHLWKSNLNNAHLQFANLQGAHLWKSDLRGARLSAAKLHNSHMAEANLQGAVYTSSKSGCPLENMDSCPTVFPEGFDPAAAGMILWTATGN